jgi:hypothetical protein
MCSGSWRVLSFKPLQMIKQINNTKNYFISDEGYCFKTKNGKDILIPLEIYKGAPKVKIGGSRINLPFLMIEHFIELKSIHYRISFKIEDGRIPLKNISIKYIDKSCSIDELNIFRYKCDEKANSQNSRVGHINKISSLDVLDCLRRSDFKCFYCNEKIKSKSWHLDHFNPISKGGTNSPDNIVASCKECNLMKGYLDADVFIEKCFKITKHDKFCKGFNLNITKIK